MGGRRTPLWDDDGNSEKEALYGLPPDDGAWREVDGHAGMSDQSPEVGPGVDPDDPAQCPSLPDDGVAPLDDDDVLVVESGREPGHRRRGGLDGRSVGTVREDQDITGEAETRMPGRAGEGVDRHVHAQHVGWTHQRTRRERQLAQRRARLVRDRCDGERRDGIAEGPEEGTRVLARLVENPDRTRIGAVDPLGVAGPRPMSARTNADADEVERSIGLGSTRLHGRDDGNGCVTGYSARQGAGDEGELGVSRRPRRAQHHSCRPFREDTHWVDGGDVPDSGSAILSTAARSWVIS